MKWDNLINRILIQELKKTCQEYKQLKLDYEENRIKLWRLFEI